jgi:ubiquinone/menaquinone biosynthesis C-methylase UbiE
MSDQKDMWNKNHADNVHASMVGNPQKYAEEVAPFIKPGMRLLELGCGVGSDATYFASLGAEVTATDFSDVVIEQDNARDSKPNPIFQVADITQPLSFSENTFDVVYAHLSLHYYNEAVTSDVFKEIARVLMPGGMLFFSCKSVHDPLYGQGDEVEPGVFDRNGHLRHFFSVDYTKTLLVPDFEAVKINEVEGQYDGFTSAFVQVWAKKKGS